MDPNAETETETPETTSVDGNSYTDDVASYAERLRQDYAPAEDSPKPEAPSEDASPVEPQAPEASSPPDAPDPATPPEQQTSEDAPSGDAPSVKEAKTAAEGIADGDPGIDLSDDKRFMTFKTDHKDVVFDLHDPEQRKTVTEWAQIGSSAGRTNERVEKADLEGQRKVIQWARDQGFETYQDPTTGEFKLRGAQPATPSAPASPPPPSQDQPLASSSAMTASEMEQMRQRALDEGNLDDYDKWTQARLKAIEESRSSIVTDATERARQAAAEEAKRVFDEQQASIQAQARKEQSNRETIQHIQAGSNKIMAEYEPVFAASGDPEYWRAEGRRQIENAIYNAKDATEWSQLFAAGRAKVHDLAARLQQERAKTLQAAGVPPKAPQPRVAAPPTVGGGSPAGTATTFNQNDQVEYADALRKRYEAAHG